MTESPAVSVVIPVFNRADLIEATLNSVRSQTYRPLEVIVVDDGSVDNTAAVVADWSAQHGNEALVVRRLTQKNSGPNAARNRGVVESTSAFIAFLDSDDRWLPEKVEKQVAELQADEHIGGVYCGLRTVDLDSGVIQPVTARAYPAGNLLARLLIQDVSSPTSCWMVRKTCFEEAGCFDIALPARQDWDMWIRLSAKYPIGCVPEVLVEMGEHAGARVRTDPSREIVAHGMIFKKYAQLRSQLPFWVSLAARAAMYRRRGRVYLHRKGFRLKAVGLQLLAILVWPFCFDSYAALLGTFMPANFRSKLHVLWNRVFGKTGLGIRSH